MKSLVVILLIFVGVCVQEPQPDSTKTKKPNKADIQKETEKESVSSYDDKIKQQSVSLDSLIQIKKERVLSNGGDVHKD